MKIDSINTTMGFRQSIKPSKAMNSGIKLVEETSNSYLMKDLNFSKKFIDNINKILNHPSNEGVEFFSNEAAKHTHANMLQEGYLLVESVNDYANQLGPKKKSMTILDDLKANIDDLNEQIELLKEHYRRELQAELERIKQKINC